MTINTRICPSALTIFDKFDIENLTINSIYFYFSAPLFMIIDRLFLPTSTTIEFINPYDVLYCQSDGTHTTVYTVNEQSICVIRSMIVLQRELPSFLVRVSQTVIVNKLHIERIDKRNKKIYIRGGTVISFTMTVRNLLERILEQKAENALTS